MKIAAIIQARMGSTRLPGKVFMDLEGEPMLVRVVNRLERAAMLNSVIVATTVEPADDQIAEFCAARGWPCFRGSQDDVLDRYYKTAIFHKVDAVVRITSDCPLIEPVIVDRVVKEFRMNQTEIDYVTNSRLEPLTFPRGLDTELMSFETLKRTWIEAKEPSEREHVTLYIYRHPEIFNIYKLDNDVDYSYMRWAVDTKEDLEFVRHIYEHFGHDRFSFQQVLAVLEQHPEWLKINKHIRQKEV